MINSRGIMSSLDDITELLLEISYLRQLQQCILANTCVFVKVQIEYLLILELVALLYDFGRLWHHLRYDIMLWRHNWSITLFGAKHQIRREIVNIGL